MLHRTIRLSIFFSISACYLLVSERSGVDYQEATERTLGVRWSVGHVTLAPTLLDSFDSYKSSLHIQLTLPTIPYYRATTSTSNDAGDYDHSTDYRAIPLQHHHVKYASPHPAGLCYSKPIWQGTGSPPHPLAEIPDIQLLLKRV